MKFFVFAKTPVKILHRKTKKKHQLKKLHKRQWEELKSWNTNWTVALFLKQLKSGKKISLTKTFFRVKPKVKATESKKKIKYLDMKEFIEILLIRLQFWSKLNCSFDSFRVITIKNGFIWNIFWGTLVERKKKIKTK